MCANSKLSQQRGSPQKGVPQFVPTLSRKLSQTVAEGQYRESPVSARKTSSAANYRTRSQLSLDGLLISGLQVRVLPGSPTNSGSSPETRWSFRTAATLRHSPTDRTATVRAANSQHFASRDAWRVLRVHWHIALLTPRVFSTKLFS
jgi:hypothetical protein